MNSTPSSGRPEDRTASPPARTFLTFDLPTIVDEFVDDGSDVVRGSFAKSDLIGA